MSKKLKRMLSSNAELSSQWHPTKNAPLTPDDVTLKSNKNFWWKCKEDEDHEWEAPPNNRVRAKVPHCPFCIGKRVSKTNNLQHLHPDLALQWHPKKNGSLQPDQFTAGSNKKIWWKCPIGDGHEWETQIAKRTTRGDGCPFCSGQRVSDTNNLLAVNPKLSQQWHPTKNGDLKPEDVTSGTDRKVWWKCLAGDDHVWIADVHSRQNGMGCPFCSGNRASNAYNLAVINPELAKQWHPNENGNLKPEEVTPKSGKTVWWKCQKGPDHEWEEKIANRALGHGCPFCSGHRVSKTNNLEYLFPELASEWLFEKNGGLSPKDFTPGSGKKVWWQCKLNKAHQWKAVIGSRTKKKVGCPHCSAKSSAGEVRVLCELRAAFPECDVVWREKYFGKELDIFLSEERIAIEYDGWYWHKDKALSDKKKTNFLQTKKITVVRVREYPLEKIGQNDVVVNHPISKKECNEIVKQICILGDLDGSTAKSYANLKTFSADKEYNRYLSYLPSPPPEFSLAHTHPEISLEWNLEKNAPLEPTNFTSGSDKKVWWRCLNNKNHEWITSIYSRTNGSSCPDCSKRRPTAEFNLLTVNPQLAAQWHPTKNKKLLPSDLLPTSNRRVWWQCPEGDDHQWQASPNGRRTLSCPFCIGKRVSKTNNLKFCFPELSLQWHPSKNGNLTPEKITFGSGKKVWWKCSEGEDHEWCSAISSRTSGIGCPFCSNKRVSKTNNLAVVNPYYAAQWHPERNGSLLPTDVTSGSDKKVWWKCPYGDDHEWQSSVDGRVRNSIKCPFCSGKRASKSYNLASEHPDIANQWHPTKNGNLRPTDFTPGSDKKVWWKCSENNHHDWLASIYSRTRSKSQKCPMCNN